jgi:hypothetical protein
VAFAPLVLTLRSGALAAASCTGVKIATGAYTKDGGLRAGKIKNAPGVVEGDVCVEAGALQACGTDQSRVETLSNLTVNNTAPVTTRYDDRGSWLSCGEPSQFVGATHCNLEFSVGGINGYCPELKLLNQWPRV